MTLPTDPPDPLAPLWQKAQQAADRGDIRGLLFVWKSLAEQGAWHICARIGEIYERGSADVKADFSEALSWYRRAVFEADDPVAHVGLGRAYYNGHGVDSNYSTALHHFKKADKGGVPEARLYLGLMYYRGTAVERNTQIAEDYFHAAVSDDFAVAYAYLARIALSRGRLLKASVLFCRGVALGRRIAAKDPTDPRLLGL